MSYQEEPASNNEKQVTFDLRSLNKLFKDQNQYLGRYSPTFKILSDLLAILDTSQFEGAEYESVIGI